MVYVNMEDFTQEESSILGSTYGGPQKSRRDSPKRRDVQCHAMAKKLRVDAARRTLIALVFINMKA